MSDTPLPFKLSDAEFHALSAAALASLEASVDQWLEDDVVDIDAQRSGGLLELKLPNGSHLVVNTQPPLHELWLAARSGGFHYKWDGRQWRDSRDGSEFFEVISRCVSEQSGQALRFTPPAAQS